jgi:uncharacterized protein (TIGR03790 family)
VQQFSNVPPQFASNGLRMRIIRYAILLAFLAPLWARAGGDEVVVVYNRNMPESKGVADYYARVRHVPEKQIYGFDLPITEVMSRNSFRHWLQLPLAEKLKSDGLWKFGKTTLTTAKGERINAVRCVVASKIRYVVLCYGVPLKISNDSSVQEPQPLNVASLFQVNNASVDSELAWLPLIQNEERLSGPMINRLYGTTNEALLSPTNGILLVARLDGPSADIAMGLVKKSIQAERDGLWGRAYFDARGITDSDSLYKLGDVWMLDSAEICRELGFDITVDTNAATFQADFPMSQIAIYAGWYSADADGPFAQPTVEFMPGAFAYHLHSYSATTIRSTTRAWCGPLLAKGATCTMGCVDEPSIQFTPNVAAFLARWALNRFTFGEAAWAAQPALSWQTTVIGDPLYRPFAKSPTELNAELTRTHNPFVEWSYVRAVNGAIIRGASLSQMEEVLENLPLTATSAVLTEKLAELCDSQGKPDAAIQYYRKALTLNPSPQQRIRIRLTLGQKLLDQNNTAGAIDNYRALLAESPGYPGKDSISDKIAGLEQKITRAR